MLSSVGIVAFVACAAFWWGRRGMARCVFKKTSALDAAAKVFGKAGQPMTCKEIIEAMSKKGYWTSPGGATPPDTLYSAMLREIKTKGTEARFKKTELGNFASNGYHGPTPF